MSIIETFLSSASHIWAEYHCHPFVTGIRDGTLQRSKFRYYIVQDYLYLVDYAKVFAVGIAKARSAETMKLFASYVHQLTDGEMDIHRGYMARLELTEDEVRNMPMALANRSYTSYMLRVAYEEGEAEVLAAILSCAYSYEVIAQQMVKSNPASLKHPFYGDWICGYASEEYSKENQVLIGMLEKLTNHYTAEQIRHLTEIFVTCSRYELAFWDMAWNISR